MRNPVRGHIHWNPRDCWWPCLTLTAGPIEIDFGHYATRRLGILYPAALHFWAAGHGLTIWADGHRPTITRGTLV